MSDGQFWGSIVGSVLVYAMGVAFGYWLRGKR